MSAALASRVEGALGSLNEPQRRALELRERDGAGYREIADVVGTGREGVADLLVGARLTVWARLHDESPPPRRTPQCGPARRVLAAQADGEPVSTQDLDRAREHLAGCEPCVEARIALREAEIACRAWRSNPAPQLPVDANRAPLLPESGSNPARLASGGSGAARFARRRLIAAVVGVVLLVAVLAIAFGGGGDGTVVPGAPKPGPGSAKGSGRDVVPPPGDKFCPDNRTNCK